VTSSGVSWRAALRRTRSRGGTSCARGRSC
jgi:hypothetical protein